MRYATAVVLSVVVAGSVSAQLVPGDVVTHGKSFAIIADLNGDGLSDLIQDTAVLVNHGGTFSEPVSLNLQGTDHVIDVMDVNGDGRKDLLTRDTSTAGPGAFPGPRAYRIYLGNSSGGYERPVSIPVDSPRALLVADADGDGRDDLVVVRDIREGIRTVATEMTVLRSRGDGSFDSLTPFHIAREVQNFTNSHLLSGDFDHDGHPDFVVRCVDDLVVLQGAGDGTFRVDSRYLPQSIGIWALQLADVDADGQLDILLAGQRSVRAFLGDGHGNFPRTTAGLIARIHDNSVPDYFQFLNVDQINQPRKLAIGRFTSLQTQIAAGTGEGDIVILQYQQGRLQEVARNATDFWLTDVDTGSFTSPGSNDLYATGNLIYGDLYPRPRVFAGVADAAHSVEPVQAVSLRRRGVGRPSDLIRMEVSKQGSCVTSGVETWSMRADGPFYRGSDAETFVDGNTMYLRTRSGEISGALSASGSGWGGVVATATEGCKTPAVTMQITMN